jgi:glucose/arabinose dehydrogenase
MPSRPRYLLPLVLLPAAVWIAAPAADPPPAAFECRWADSPITIDGNADEPAWADAPVIDSFRQPWLGDGARPKAATRAKLLWDREYLYFFADMDDADLFADVAGHDGRTWDNDVFELFFRPAADKPGYFEFQVNALGTVFDCFFPKPGRGSKAAGEFHLDAKVKLRGTLNRRDDVDRGWAVEGRIPWADFLRAGGRPELGETWRFALCRYDYDRRRKGPELSTVAPIRERKQPGFFHQTEDYARLTFVGPGGTIAARPPGLPDRVPLTTSRVVGSPDPPRPYRLKRVYPDFRPAWPILVKAVPGGSELLVITQPYSYGPTALLRVKDDPAVKTADAVKVMDTPDGGTAYDIAFHPKFAENGFVYVGWNGKDKARGKHYSRVTRYTMSPKPPFALDTASGKTVIEWESHGHNGAAVCFGTDGMLYVTSGDGTSDSDTNLMGQRTGALLAKVLRIDVDRAEGGKPYAVPKDNPFVGDARFAPETWAYGLRNPWRIASDPATGHIWVGNNGQDLWETAHLVRKGENYGWSVMEGGSPFYPGRQAGPTPFVKPTIEHHHSEFRSLTGGLVYHGDRYPDLRGAYLYGDYSTGRIWAMKHDGAKSVWHKELAWGPIQITAFGTNTRGELLVCDHHPAGESGCYTLEPTPADATPSAFPRKLSESGLFASVKDHRMAAGVVPYSVNAPFWSDGLHKERFLAVPAGGTIGHTRTRGWNFPAKTVIVKSFAIEGEEGNPASRKWVETRFLTKQGHEWAGYTYVWNDAGTDAELVPAAGMDREFTVRTAAGVRKQVWHYPSRAECMVCHSRAANFVLGLCDVQMNKDHDYGGRTDNQLRVLDHLGLLKADWAGELRAVLVDRAKAKGLKGEAVSKYVSEHAPQAGQRVPPAADAIPDQAPDLFPRLTDPSDRSQDLNRRARSWLHANCSSCHVEAGGGNARMELDFATAADKMRLIGEKPMHTTFDLPDARLVAPGHPNRSVLLRRVGVRGTGQMPPLSTNRPDAAGVELLREWIASLKE